MSKIYVIQQILRNTKCLGLCPLLENQHNHALIDMQQTFSLYTLESRIIGGVGIIGGLNIVIIINNRGGWTELKK